MRKGERGRGPYSAAGDVLQGTPAVFVDYAGPGPTVSAIRPDGTLRFYAGAPAPVGPAVRSMRAETPVRAKLSPTAAHGDWVVTAMIEKSGAYQ
jgi:hypothetical protein